MSSIRRAVEGDAEFIIAMAREAYPGRALEGAEKWARWVANHPDRLFLVGKHCAGAASVYWRYGSELYGRLEFICADKTPGMEPLIMVRELVNWAKGRGVRRFRLDSDTGYDFGPFAKVMGGEPIDVKAYDITFGEAL